MCLSSSSWVLTIEVYCSKYDCIHSWWNVVRYLNCLRPIVARLNNIQEVRLTSTETDSCQLEPIEVAYNLFGSVKVSLPWDCSKARHCHDSCGDIESPQTHCPLKGPYQGLVPLYTNLSSSSESSVSGWSFFSNGEVTLVCGLVPNMRSYSVATQSMYCCGDIHNIPSC